MVELSAAQLVSLGSSPLLPHRMQQISPSRSSSSHLTAQHREPCWSTSERPFCVPPFFRGHCWPSSGSEPAWHAIIPSGMVRDHMDSLSPLYPVFSCNIASRGPPDTLCMRLPAPAQLAQPSQGTMDPLHRLLCPPPKTHSQPALSQLQRR